MLDDSLLLGWDKRKNKPQTSSEVALSPSTIKLFKEDPMKFYYRKVLKLKEPESIALAFGSASHSAMDEFYLTNDSDRIRAAMQAFDKEMRSSFRKVDDRTIRVNPDDPMNPRNKVEIEVSLDEILEMGHTIVEPILQLLDAGDQEGLREYSPLYAQKHGVEHVELALGELAEIKGADTVKINLFDQRDMRFKIMPAGLVSGVPIHGYVDLVCAWPDGTQAIIDHKFVSSCISYYPPAWADYPDRVEWTMYDPTYDPKNDLQLDLYAYCSGITRAGFQFITKNPQYVQKDGTLHPDWVDEQAWRRMKSTGDKLPMVMGTNPNGHVHYAAVWRPASWDHPSRPTAYSRPHTMARAAKTVREVAEQITESLILHQAGVAPEIAFPAGHPDEIARKACPYCHFGPSNQNICPTPRTTNKSSEEAYKEAWVQRELACQNNTDIMERRKLWKSNNQI